MSRPIGVSSPIIQSHCPTLHGKSFSLEQTKIFKSHIYFRSQHLVPCPEESMAPMCHKRSFSIPASWSFLPSLLLHRGPSVPAASCPLSCKRRPLCPPLSPSVLLCPPLSSSVLFCPALSLPGQRTEGSQTMPSSVVPLCQETTAIYCRIVRHLLPVLLTVLPAAIEYLSRLNSSASLVAPTPGQWSTVRRTAGKTGPAFGGVRPLCGGRRTLRG